MVVVAGGLAWAVDHSHQRSAVVEWINQLNCVMVATGHHVEKLPDGKYKVWSGRTEDADKPPIIYDHAP